MFSEQHKLSMWPQYANLQDSCCFLLLTFLYTSNDETKHSQGTWTGGNWWLHVQHSQMESNLPAPSIELLNSYRTESAIFLLQDTACKQGVAVIWKNTNTLKTNNQKKNSYWKTKDIISSVILQMTSLQARSTKLSKRIEVIKHLKALGLQVADCLLSLNSYLKQPHQTLTLPSSFAIGCMCYLKAISDIQAEFPMTKISSTCPRSLWLPFQTPWNPASLLIQAIIRSLVS